MPQPLRREPPDTEETLRLRCQSLAGRQLVDIAAELYWPVPDSLHSNKGWIGQLLEAALGCDAHSKSEPDFTALNIELKTLPVSSTGQVRESTYVCMVPLQHTHGLQWEQSCVYRKLSHVLWVPVFSDETDIGKRHVGNPLLWHADVHTLASLQSDWEEFIEQINLGRLSEISSRHGELLQIRPKGANAKVISATTDADGNAIQTLPRGFYLRPEFTQRLLTEQYF